MADATPPCAICAREIPPHAARSIPEAVVWAAATAAAFFHGGMWVREQFKRPCHARCAVLATAGLAAAASGVFGIAAAGAILWVRAARRNW